MNSASPCVGCPNRLAGFCGALFGAYPGNENPAAWQRVFPVRAGGQIATRNQPSGDVLVLCTGWAFRYLQFADGRRQILQFLLPGDVLSPTSISAETYFASAKALTEVMVSGFSRDEIRARSTALPALRSAIANCHFAEARELAELAAVMGQCSAEERIAFLLLHLIRRIAVHNVIRENRYPFPLRQQHIADAVGLTPVHVSRVFGLLRGRGILSVAEGVLNVADMGELEQLGPLK